MPTGTQGDKISDPTADRSNPPVSRQSGQPMATPESRQEFRETRSATFVFDGTALHRNVALKRVRAHA
jgi:hypothetical protein